MVHAAPHVVMHGVEVLLQRETILGLVQDHSCANSKETELTQLNHRITMPATPIMMDQSGLGVPSTWRPGVGCGTLSVHLMEAQALEPQRTNVNVQRPAQQPTSNLTLFVAKKACLAIWEIPGNLAGSEL